MTNSLTLNTDFSGIGDLMNAHGNCFYPYDPNPNQPIIREYYPQYIATCTSSSLEKSFKIVEVLMKAKLIKLDKVKDLIELVNKISEII